MRGSSWCEVFRPQCRRGSADVLTINRPDARVGNSIEKQTKKRNKLALSQSPKRPSDYQGHRAVISDRMGTAMPILIGAAMIAAAILLSTLITAIGTRYAGIETPNEETLWLIDRLTGNVYKCQAPERGRAACEAEIATGSIGERGKR
jgi:hypothetical protein